ncbi:MAG TPA: Arm DNA-binding domain-containing protein [Vicinamibacterales bacterium]|nr:Arm DNA-binding domain-containing protein [Vicinamibacterales bacterium]
MPVANLTARKIAAIRPSPHRAEYHDRKVAGLSLRVAPSGAKSWTLMYRNRQRVRRRMTLGGVDVLSLAKGAGTRA